MLSNSIAWKLEYITQHWKVHLPKRGYKISASLYVCYWVHHIPLAICIHVFQKMLDPDPKNEEKKHIFSTIAQKWVHLQDNQKYLVSL